MEQKKAVVVVRDDILNEGIVLKKNNSGTGMTL